MVGGGSKHVGEGSKPKANIDDAYAYLRARWSNRDGCITEVEQRLKGHRDLISGSNAFFIKVFGDQKLLYWGMRG
ncbi:unnamed protein product [Arabidopsis lyrata]|uniref:Predicted protein n=1 Tax=Arabidopsis lyrata subsp. lyrata TaxID=81972 RepID=D7KPI2_ARALL|nr:predicted protein [Arabidopsis lyrata subsp. lyrata]CAH8253410.1 unnamed protein product [Arabidopsis lyrata]